MYLVLLGFGSLLAVAGVTLAASGVSIHEHTLDATTVTPGVVAVIGGCVLFGLGLALRVLQRIEQVLAARPMPGVVRGGPVLPVEASELPGGAGRIAVPSRAQLRAHTAPVAGFLPRSPLEEKRPDEISEKLPAPPEGARNAAEADVAPSPNAIDPNSSLSGAPLPVEQVAGEVSELRAARRLNGAGRITPRLDLNARFPVTPDRPRGPAFDSMWPKGPRPSRALQQPPAPPVSVTLVEAARDDKPASEMPAPAVATDEAPAPAIILKSGVVDGMAYTLFSDGSIEAELPQGRLRFGSITELRNHIEQSA
jgi:hypothetical protein